MHKAIWKFLQSEASDLVVGGALIVTLSAWALVLAVTLPSVAGQ